MNTTKNSRMRFIQIHFLVLFVCVCVSVCCVYECAHLYLAHMEARGEF